MGLDITVYTSSSGFRAGSYSGFHNFRILLAREEGINLEEMIGFTGTKSWDEVDTVLRPLLDHSDSDGEIWGYEVDGKIVARLREIHEKWSDSKVEELRSWAPVVEEWAAAFDDICYDGGVMVFH